MIPLAVRVSTQLYKHRLSARLRCVQSFTKSSNLQLFRPFSICGCRQRSDVIPPPHIEGQERNYSPKIRKIVDDISTLTLIEVADLNILLKKTLNISDAPLMSMAAMPMAQAAAAIEEEVPEVKQEKTSFTVKLVKYDESKKVALIKEIKNLIHGMNLVQAKKFVESAPQPVKSDIPKDEAETLLKALQAVGATVELE